eukprot:1721431-Pyramimonas_sp.AAC.1
MRCGWAAAIFRRRWVGGQRPHGYWLGSRGWPLMGLLGGSFEASWGPCWGLLGPLGGLLGLLGVPFGGPLGPLGGLFGPPWGLLGLKAGLFGSSSPSWVPLGAVLRLSWA